MLKKRMIKRIFNLLSVLFILLIASISAYFYIVVKNKVNSAMIIINALKSSNDTGMLNSLISQIAGIFDIFVMQISLFFAIIVCLVLFSVFLFRLYLIENKNALIDPLTEIYNRKAILFGLDTEIKRAVRYRHSVSIAILDIDFFKKYNDLNGHVAGDALLKKFGKILRKSIRKGDFVGRIGGEEFLIIFPETRLKKAYNVCERLRRVTERARFFGEENMPGKRVTISAGVSEFDGSKKIEKEQLMEAADKLLYKAKEAGRNMVVSGNKE